MSFQIIQSVLKAKCTVVYVMLSIFPALDTSLVNENRNILEDVSNHTIFHNINYLGASRMNEPKNERLIHGIMKEYNVLDDLRDPEEEKTSVDIILGK